MASKVLLNRNKKMSENSSSAVSPGTIGWNEIITSNAEESVKFYTGLLGWTTEVVEMPGGMSYTMFKNGEVHVGGCMQPSELKEGFKPMWLQYINTLDLDASVEKSIALGATVIEERMDLPMGSFAVIADPLGAVFAFWQNNPDAECPSEE